MSQIFELNNNNNNEILQARKTTTSATTTTTTIEVNANVLIEQQQQQQNSTTNAINYLLFSSNNKSIKNQDKQQAESKLNDLLKDTKHNHVSDAVNLQLANSIWFKMHENVEEFARQKTNQARPIINKLLDQANVTSNCKKSLNDVLDRIYKLDNWALEMYNSFGDFPTSGLFEGTLTSHGSYHQCVNIEPNDFIERPQYCTFKFQPIIPKRPKYHNLLAKIENLANFTSKDDVFHHLAQKAHYYYYVKLRLATCMPTKCEMNDFELLGRQVAVNTYLQFSGVSCLEKEVGFNLDGAQIFSLTILISLASISILGTIIHLFNLRSFVLINDDETLSSSSTTKTKTTLTTDRTMTTDLNSSSTTIKNVENSLTSSIHSSSAATIVLEHQNQQLLLENSNKFHKRLDEDVGIEEQHGEEEEDEREGEEEEEQVALQTSVILDHHNHNHCKTTNDNCACESIISSQVDCCSSIERRSSSSASACSNSLMNKSKFKSRLLYFMDILLHFSLIKNGKKLFDTSTSRHNNNNNKNNNNNNRKNNENKKGNNNRKNKDSISTSNDECCFESSTSTSTSSSCDVDSSLSSSARSSARSDVTSSAVNGPGNGQSSDISCVHGLRFWTISWIIFGHTMQYTEWAGFGRAYQVEKNIVSFFLHPLLNATFSVDTFFLISGLLTTYVTWSITKGQYKRFNKFAFLISRYLRLTPQVLLVILLFIIFPLMGDGPYWKGLIQKESDNCKKNWWVNALYLQAFIKQDQICNLVTWWLSIEMFYHLISIFVIIALLHSTRTGLFATLTIGGGLTAVSCYLHFINHYPPNMLPTLLQRYEIWDSIVLKYFWTPYPHAPSYFVGLLLGYVLYNKSIKKLTNKQVKYGWTIFAICYLSILFGTYNWNNNAPYSRLTSTIYYNLSQILWSLATGWAILACAMGHGGWLNKFLSSSIFVPLGRATYMTYLSHMIIVMSYPAKMNMLIEPSYVVFLYIFISNLFLSYAFGIILTLVYESPILHLQKLLVTNMAQKFVGDETRSSSSSSSTANITKNNRSTAIRNNNIKGNRLNNQMIMMDSKMVKVSLFPIEKSQQQENLVIDNSNPC